MRSLSEPCLIWFTKGQGRITVSGVTRGYTAHNAVFVPAGIMHAFEAGPQVFGTALFFGRSADVVLPKSALHLRIRDVHSQQELNVLLDSLGRELDSGTPAHDRAAAAYAGLIGVWLERQARKADVIEAPRQDATRRLVTRYTALLERNYRTGMGVAEFAAALGVTPTHLTRCCNAACGHPAIALLQDRRLFEARKLLTETRLPVGKIAEQLGFTSAAYFSRAFQHLAGKSPTAFRKGG